MDKNHPEVQFGKTGVLIINLGTPDSTGWWDIRKYLKEFLSDRRVIEVNPIIWQIILNLFILTFRPSKTAHAYKQIWRAESNESPLLYFTKQQSQKLDKSRKLLYGRITKDSPVEILLLHQIIKTTTRKRKDLQAVDRIF